MSDTTRALPCVVLSCLYTYECHCLYGFVSSVVAHVPSRHYNALLMAVFVLTVHLALLDFDCN